MGLVRARSGTTTTSTTLVQIGEALRAVLATGVELDAICALQAADVPSRLRDLGVDAERAALLGRVLAAARRDRACATTC